MASINQNFEMYEGNSKKIKVTVTDEVDGQPTNLTECTIKWGLKRSLHDPLTLVSKDTSLGIIIDPDPFLGKFTVWLKSEDTEGLSGVFYHEAELMDAEGNVSTVLTGTAVIKKAGI